MMRCAALLVTKSARERPKSAGDRFTFFEGKVRIVVLTNCVAEKTPWWQHSSQRNFGNLKQRQYI
jgi:hypothetical protein